MSKSGSAYFELPRREREAPEWKKIMKRILERNRVLQNTATEIFAYADAHVPHTSQAGPSELYPAGFGC